MPGLRGRNEYLDRFAAQYGSTSLSQAIEALPEVERNLVWTRIHFLINVALVGVTCARMIMAWIGKKPTAA
jgi:hypothetical protein